MFKRNWICFRSNSTKTLSVNFLFLCYSQIMKYRCRAKIPTLTEWRDVEAERFEDSASEFQFLHYTKPYVNNPLTYKFRYDKGSKVELIEFVLVEVEGHGEFVSRLFRSGLFRIHESQKKIG